MGKQPAEQSLQKQSRDSVSKTQQQACFDDTLREAALTSVPALIPHALLD